MSTYPKRGNLQLMVSRDLHEKGEGYGYPPTKYE
jgi:hypothetical protein